MAERMRVETLFGLLILAQATHSIEEYFGRLWESFPPAHLLTGLVSSDREVGFLVLNTALISFGIWCWLVPVRRRTSVARPVLQLWIAIETINGIGHPVWSLLQRAYTPGVATSPILLFLATILWRARRRARTLA